MIQLPRWNLAKAGSSSPRSRANASGGFSLSALIV